MAKAKKETEEVKKEEVGEKKGVIKKKFFNLADYKKQKGLDNPPHKQYYLIKNERICEKEKQVNS